MDLRMTPFLGNEPQLSARHERLVSGKELCMRCTSKGKRIMAFLPPHALGVLPEE